MRSIGAVPWSHEGMRFADAKMIWLRGSGSDGRRVATLGLTFVVRCSRVLLLALQWSVSGTGLVNDVGCESYDCPGSDQVSACDGWCSRRHYSRRVDCDPALSVCLMWRRRTSWASFIPPMSQEPLFAFTPHCDQPLFVSAMLCALQLVQ